MASISFKASAESTKLLPSDGTVIKDKARAESKALASISFKASAESTKLLPRVGLVIVTVFIPPVPLAVTRSPTKLIVEASDDKEDPSS